MRKMGKFYWGAKNRLKINSASKDRININAFPFDHIHNLTYHEALDATCTTAGHNAYEECPRCGYTTYEEITALGHDIRKYNGVLPTCTTSGYFAYEDCSKCDYTTFERVPALGHVEVIDPAVEPTCTETGLTEGKHCSRCNAVLKAQTTINTIAHNYVNRVCTVCGSIDETPSSGLAFSTTSANGGYASVTGIGTCTDTDIVIPSSYNGYPVTTIQQKAFKDCLTLTSVVLPDSVTSVSYSAFSGCANLKSVIFGNNITKIDSSAFADCPIKHVILPSSISSMSNLSFSDRTVVYWPHNSSPVSDTIMTSTSYSKIYINAHQDTLHIENDIHYVLDLANKTAIVSSITDNYEDTILQIPNIITVNDINYTVNAIGRNAFANCTTLKTAAIPNNILYEPQIFIGCANLSTLEIALFNYTSDYSGRSFDELRYLSSAEDIANLEYLTILDGITEIPHDMFDYCTNLTSLSIPSSVTDINEYAFDDTKNLTYITVDPANTVYDSRDNCNAIIKTATNELIKGCGSTIIPNSVTRLGYKSFSDNQVLNSIYIPSSITSIDAYVFADCGNLTSITVDPANTVYDSRDNCNAIINTATTRVAEGSNSTVIPSSIDIIGSAAFSGRHSLKSIIIPNSVTKIYSEAFNECSSLESIVLSENISSIARLSYSNCPNLKKIIIPINVTKISEKPFLNDTSLTIYCRATSKPAGWEDGWNTLDSSAGTTIPVVWGYTGS